MEILEFIKNTKFKSILLCAALGFSLISCSKADKESPRTLVNFSFSSKDGSALEDSFAVKWAKGDFDENAPQKAWGQVAPTVYTGFNCFGVLINYPEFGPQATCTKSDGTPVFSFADEAGLFSTGSSTTKEILNGFSREFFLVGFYSTTTCPSFQDLDTNEANMSPPVLLGNTTSDISSSINNINIVANVSSAVEFDTCDGNGTGIVTDPCNNGEVVGTCHLWLDASYTSSLYTDSACSANVTTAGDNVLCWANRASSAAGFGNASNPSGTATYQTAASALGGVNFISVVSNILTLSPTGLAQEPTTIFVVFDADNSGPLGILNSTGTGPVTNVDMKTVSGDFLQTAYTGITATTSTNIVNTNNLTIGILQADGAAGTTNMSAQLTGYHGSNEIVYNSGTPTTVTSTDQIKIGDSATGGEYFSGTMFEIIWYQGDLTADDRGKVINYLKAKWGI